MRYTGDMILDVEGLREETNDWISDLKVYISTWEKKSDSLNVELDNIDQYEHRDMLVISEDIIPHMVPQLKIVKTLFLIYSGIV